MIDANLPGISMQPMELMGTAARRDRQRRQANGLLRRRPRTGLRAGRRRQQGWTVATTHLELEHGAAAGSAAIASGIVCCATARKPSATACRSASSRTCATASRHLHQGRGPAALRLRNFYLTYARKPKSYEGPQLSYYRKTTGLWMTGAILEAIGPAALTTDSAWGSAAGFLETQQRNGIVSVHPEDNRHPARCRWPVASGSAGRPARRLARYTERSDPWISR